jgi:ABC-2 type transport system permease protein
MNFTRITAIAKKEFIQVVRDPRSLGMAIAIPMLLLVFFGKILTFDVNDVPLVVWDQDNTQISRDYILNYRNSSYFKIVGYFDKYK